MDLPVGEHLQDHILLPIDYLANNESDIQYSRDIDNILTTENLYEYYVHNNGPIIQLPVVLTYHSTRLNDNPQWPDSVMATLIDQIGKWTPIGLSFFLADTLLATTTRPGNHRLDKWNEQRTAVGRLLHATVE